MTLASHRLWLIAMMALTLSGCHLLSRQSEIDTPVTIPQTWEGTHAAEAITVGWLAQFADPALDNLVRKALRKNFDLKADAEQLYAAIATAKATNAALYPDIDIAIQRNRSKRFVIDDQGLVSTQYQTEYSGDLTVNWEADLWGKLGDRSRASYLDAENLAALYEAARLSLAATVAQTWFNAIEATNQLTLSEQQLTNLVEALDIIESSYQAGLNSAVDVFSARSDLKAQMAVLAQDKQTLEEIKRNLNRLTGEYPSTHIEINHTSKPAASGLKPVPAGLPSGLLTRRPDINAARSHWLSQDYRRQAARKDRYPSFILTGNLGETSENLSDLLDSDDVFWSLITGITQPVFTAGRLKALEDNADALARAALAEYASTTLNAFIEVENALAAEKHLTTQYENTRQAAQLAEEAYHLALEQYQSGLIEYATVLITQRQYFTADSSQISLYNDLIQNRIDLHLALGGDFFTYEHENSEP